MRVHKTIISFHCYYRYHNDDRRHLCLFYRPIWSLMVMLNLIRTGQRRCPADLHKWGFIIRQTSARVASAADHRSHSQRMSTHKVGGGPHYLHELASSDEAIRLYSTHGRKTTIRVTDGIVKV